MTTGDDLPGVREEKGLTQDGARTSVSRRAISTRERPLASASACWETVKSLCRALGVGCDAFMEESVVKPKKKRIQK
jgi:hypothetical protein